MKLILIAAGLLLSQISFAQVQNKMDARTHGEQITLLLGDHRLVFLPDQESGDSLKKYHVHKICSRQMKTIVEDAKLLNWNLVSIIATGDKCKKFCKEANFSVLLRQGKKEHIEHLYLCPLVPAADIHI